MVDGKLLVIGGGHRLCVSTLTIHTLILPYKLVSFAGLGTNGGDLNIFKYGGLISFNVEVTEPRPRQYSFMQQVLLYGNLKQQWQDMEKARVSKLKGRKRMPRYMSHKHLYEFYEQQSELCGSQSRWATDFLSVNTIKQSTRRNYMSGADRLLDAGVVPYLCNLENTANVSFNRASLNAVRNWTVDKVKDVVELWKVRTAAGLRVNYTFSDRIGREVDGKGRGRRGTQQSSLQAENEERNEEGTHEPDNAQEISIDRPGSVHPVDVGEQEAGATGGRLPIPPGDQCQAEMGVEPREDCTGLLELGADFNPENPSKDIGPDVVMNVISGILQDVGKATDIGDIDGVLSGLMQQKRTLKSEKIVDVDLETSITIARKVKESLDPEKTTKEHQVSSMLARMALQVQSEAEQEVLLVGNGGVLGTRITLCAADLKPMLAFSLANDRSVSFTLSFLTRWFGEIGKTFVFLDSIASAGWWDEVLFEQSTGLRQLTENLCRFGMPSLEKKQDLWNSDVCMMPICGGGHWSLVLIVGLRKVFSYLRESMNADRENVHSSVAARIYFVDSYGKCLAHVPVAGNIYHFLRATYPDVKGPTAARLRRCMGTSSFLFGLQKGLQCGFYVTYHMCLLARKMGDLAETSPAQLEVLIKEGHAVYTFEQYQDDVSKRLEAMLKKYSNTGREIQVGFWGWGSGWDWGLEPSVGTDSIVGKGEHQSNYTESVRDRKRKATFTADERPKKIQFVPQALVDESIAMYSDVRSGPMEDIDCNPGLGGLGEEVGDSSKAVVPRSRTDMGEETVEVCPSRTAVTSLLEDILERVGKGASPFENSIGNLGSNMPKQEHWESSGISVIEGKERSSKAPLEISRDVVQEPPVECTANAPSPTMDTVLRSRHKQRGASMQIKCNFTGMGVEVETKGPPGNKQCSNSSKVPEFISLVLEAEALSRKVRSRKVLDQWAKYKNELIELLERMKEDGKEQE